MYSLVLFIYFSYPWHVCCARISFFSCKPIRAFRLLQKVRRQHLQVTYVQVIHLQVFFRNPSRVEANLVGAHSSSSYYYFLLSNTYHWYCRLLRIRYHGMILYSFDE